MSIRKIIVIPLIFVLVFSLSLIGYSQKNTQSSNQQTQENKIVAKVNNDKITSKELDQYAGTNQLVMSLYQQKKDFAQVLLQTEAGKNLLDKYRENKLQGLIRQKLILQEAKKRDITITQKQKDNLFKKHIQSIKQQNNITDEQLKKSLKNQGINSLEQYKKRFLDKNKDKLIINELRKQVTKDINVNEQRIRKYYDNNQGQFKVNKQAKISQILIKTETKDESEAKKEVNSILNKINKGKSFTEMAKKYSEGPNANKGGSLGYISKGQISNDFDKAAFNLNTGEISQPIKTKYGYHLIKVHDKKEAGVKSFKEVKDSIKQQLESEAKTKKWDKFVNKLKENAKIDINL